MTTLISTVAMSASTGSPMMDKAAVQDRGQETDRKDSSITNSPKPLLGEKSPGVVRIEAIALHITLINRAFIFIGVFLMAYVYVLDSKTRGAYQTTATASYNSHSLFATVNVVRSVIAAAAAPTASKIANVFGRVELVFISVIFYVIGTIVEATATNFSAFVAGAVLYQVGYTCVTLLAEVIIADITSLRSRLFFDFSYTLPYLINTWVSGDITDAVLAHSTWKWGIGMWAIIFPACVLPLLISLCWVAHKARRSGSHKKYKSSYQTLGAGRLTIALFWQLDVPGIILLLAVFGLILVPFTLAGGISSTWRSAHIIAPLVIGVVICLPAFIIWELKAPHPLVPFPLLRDRAVWAALGIALFLNFAWYMQGDYLFTTLRVSFNFTVKSATRIISLYSFTSTLSRTILGLIVYKVRRVKPFIIFGTCLFLVAFGILIYYRGSSTSAGKSGVIGAEILLGIAGGLSYSTQLSIQAATLHEHLAIVTGIYLGASNIGSALGNTVSGAIWSQVLPSRLESNLKNKTLATAVYGNPITAIVEYPVGTPVRSAIITSYKDTQRLLCITGLCLCVPLIVFSLLLRNPTLGDSQSRPDAEGGERAHPRPEIEL